MEYFWILPILAGVFDAISRNVISGVKVHSFTITSLSYFCASLWYIPWLINMGMPAEINSGLIWALVFNGPLLTWTFILTVITHRDYEMYETIPYLALTPAFMLFTGPIIGTKSPPTAVGYIGVLIVGAGMYYINCREGKVRIIDSIRNLWKSRGSRLMMLVAFIFSITSHFDYVGMTSSNAPLYLLCCHGLVAFSSGLLVLFYPRKPDEKSISPKGVMWRIFWYGTFIAVSVVFHLISFNHIEVVTFVISGKRVGLIVMSILIAMMLTFPRRKEAAEWQSLRYKVPGTIGMITGMVIIIAWG